MVEVTVACAVPAPAAPPSPTSIATAPTPTDDDKPLSRDETLGAYSDYVGELQSSLAAIGATGQMYLGRIKQDVAFSNLDAYRKDSEALKDALATACNDLMSTPQPINISDEDAAYFGKAEEVAAALCADDQSLAVDLAVAANFGVDPSDGTEPSVQKMTQERKAFESAVMAGYKHFGHGRSDVDRQTLTLKEATEGEGK